MELVKHDEKRVTMKLPHRTSKGLLFVLLCAAASLPFLLARAETPAGEGKAAIQKVLDDQVIAWNKGDLEGFMTGYWKSPDLSFYSGKDKTKGWQPTLERYRKRYQAEGREMGQLTFSEIEVDLLATDSAVVRGRWQLVTSKDKPGGLFTLLFKKRPEGWRIVHDHTSG